MGHCWGVSACATLACMFGPPASTSTRAPLPPLRRQRRHVNPRPTNSSASPELRLAVLLRDGLVCQLCGCQLTLHDRRLPTHGHAGHIISHLDGGLPTPDNLRAECASCSARGGHRLQQVALARRAALERQQQASSWL